MINLHESMEIVTLDICILGDYKGPVTLRPQTQQTGSELRRIAPTYADVWKILQARWYTLSTLEISFKHVTNTL